MLKEHFNEIVIKKVLEQGQLVFDEEAMSELTNATSFVKWTKLDPAKD